MAITNSTGNRSSNKIANQNSDLLINHTSNTANSNAYGIVTVAGSSAGDSFTRYGITSSTQWSEGIDNSDSQSYVISLSNVIGTTNAFRSTTDLLVTKPLQARFQAQQIIQASNVTGDGTAVTFGTVGTITVTYDIGSNFNAGTGVFTAPVAGIYMFVLNMYILGLTAAMTVATFDFVASGKTYRWWNGNSGTLKSSDNSILLSGMIFVNMAAGDTASSTLTISNGAKVAAIGALFTTFSGQLMA